MLCFPHVLLPMGLEANPVSINIHDQGFTLLCGITVCGSYGHFHVKFSNLDILAGGPTSDLFLC